LFSLIFDSIEASGLLRHQWLRVATSQLGDARADASLLSPAPPTPKQAEAKKDIPKQPPTPKTPKKEAPKSVVVAKKAPAPLDIDDLDGFGDDSRML
jgi:hypothetical protein